MKRWCKAFDAWLAEQKQKPYPAAYTAALLAWRRLLSQQGKLPWELAQADFEQHAAWMEAQGFAGTTITNELGALQSFYRWCDHRQVDPECGAGFNPAAAAPRPKSRGYAGAQLLSRGEVQKLLGFMRRDESALGRRDYAFCLARLRLGAPLRNLQQLRWGQIEQEAEGTWVRWRAGRERAELPEQVWESLRAWLAASGRLAGIRPDDYIFTPLVDPLHGQAQEQPGAWAQGRYLSGAQILYNLKLYGSRVGIQPEKLTLVALRYTAIQLRLEAGGSLDDSTSLQELQAFLDSRGKAKSTRKRLRRLPRLPKDAAVDGEPAVRWEPTAPRDPAVPMRKCRPPYQPGEMRKHGLYAYSQPVEAVRAVLREDIQGVEEQIAGLRRLCRGLMAMLAKSAHSQEKAQLAQAYTLNAERLAKLIEAEKRLGKGGEQDDLTEQTLATLDAASIEMGNGPVSEAIRAAALGDGAELAIDARQLVEEIAGARLVLRDTLKMALEAEQKDDTADYIRLADIYSIGCNRLMKALRAGGSEQGRLAAFLKDLFEKTLAEVQQEQGVPRL